MKNYCFKELLEIITLKRINVSLLYLLVFLLLFFFFCVLPCIIAVRGLKWSMKYDGKFWIELIWLRTETSGGLLRIR
jgi:hypothetical protein